MEALDLALPEPSPKPEYEVRRFSSDGVVIVRDQVASVYMGGTLIGAFDIDDDDRGPRNVLAVTLAKSDQFHLGRLAAAFGIGDEYLRRLRRKDEQGGLTAVIGPRRGKFTKITTELRTAWYAMFDAGRMPIDAYREQPRKQRLVYSTVWRVWDDWRRERAAKQAAEPTPEAAPLAVPGQLALPIAPPSNADLGDDPVTPDEFEDDLVPMTAQPVRGGKLVQHVGTWILLALAGEMGLHEEAQRAFESRYPDGLRIAIDAVICALAIRQMCIEGVRRLATPTGATLLRAERVPTASGVRKVLGRLLAQTDGGAVLEARMAERLIATARSEDGPAIFYVDNHLRPYTGNRVVRKGWRMQDKRVLPGTTDYYAHDEDGRPMFRVPAPSHDHLTEWLLPIGKRLREALGPDEIVLLAFDRGGAYPEQLAALRDAGFDFVTYERKPYAELPTTAFHPTTICGEEVGLHESRLRNLGRGRGRIRRIVVRMGDGRQVSFLASSKLPAERLVEILWLRWRQENGFKHGNERWGINHLDGRRVEPYPPGTIIPNPARRKLERALKIWRSAEGDARRKLARLPAGDLRRDEVERELATALQWQRDLEALRPLFPKHAPVEETELAGKLVRHTGKLKAIVDVIRIVCANAESELAAVVAPHMRRPREAKKLIANLLAAPGKVAVTEHAIMVRLAPAANRSELEAIQHLLEHLNQRELRLPSDHKRLPLRFESHVR
jgi:Transposase DDE domain